MCDENDQLCKRAPHFRTGALQEVFREAIGNIEKDVVSKPKAHILAVTKENTQCIIPDIKKKKSMNSNTGWVSLNQLKPKNLLLLEGAAGTSTEMTDEYYDLVYSHKETEQTKSCMFFSIGLLPNSC